MTNQKTTAEHWRLQLIAVACALQHATGTESNVIPLPGTKKYLLIGDEAALTKLLAAEQPLNFPDPAPLALRILGGLMANVLYQIEQRPGDSLAGAADDLRKQWDEAVRVDRQAAQAQPAAVPADVGDLMAVDCPACENGAACDECHGQGKIIVGRADMAALATTEHDHSEGGHHD